MIQEHELIPFAVSGLPQGPWLVLAPHPDDETFGMGGTLMRASREGIPVSLIVLTDGAQAGEGPTEERTSTREAEARAAADRLGIRDIEFWREPDRALHSRSELTERLANRIDAVCPASLFFPSPMELHPDHRATAELAWRAMQKVGFSGHAYAYEISVQAQINRLVDISEVIDDKRAAMAVYASQQAQNDYIGVVIALNKARTYTLPVEITHAEGFFAYEAEPGKDLAYHTIQSLKPYWQTGAVGIDSPLVSVIVRTKDRPRLLERALRSVAEQIYPNIELIVVNDGGISVRDRVTQLEGVVTSGQYIELEQNVGRSAAANRGLDRAKGEYLIFLDDDDWFYSDHVSALVRAIESDRAVLVAYAGVESLRREEGGTFERLHVFNEPFNRGRLLIDNFIPMHAALFSRDLVAAGCRLDENLDTYEDWDFWVQLCRHTHFRHVDHVSAAYQIGDGSGFGVSDDTQRIERGYRQFFAKWMPLWSPQQKLEIAEYLREAGNRDVLRARLEQQGVDVGTLDRLVVPVEASHGRVALADRGDANAPGRQTGRFDDLRRQCETLSRRVQEMEASRSWRLTRPLRAISGALRLAKRSCGSVIETLVLRLALVNEILRSDGVRRFVWRSYQKLALRDTIPTLSCRAAHGRGLPASVPTSSAPKCSVIVPIADIDAVSGGLRTLATEDCGLSMEVIAVANPRHRSTLERVAGLLVVDQPDTEDAVAANNAGAREAKGDHLVFLAADVVPCPGWLGPLVEALDSSSSPAIVGGRVVSPDGRLESGGGLVWRGSLHCYGRGWRATDPRVSYRRRVDFAPPGCWAVPRTVFNEHGGLDRERRALLPAVADLAARLWEGGQEVWYVPAATVRRVTDDPATCEPSFVGRYENASERPGRGLARGEADQKGMDLAKDRGVGRRALVVDALMLRPDQDSGALRMSLLLDLLQETGFKVTFAAANLEFAGRYGAALQDRGIEVLYAPAVPSLKRYLQEHGGQFDAAILSRAETAKRLLGEVRRHAPDAEIIFDTVDLHFLREQRLAELTKKRMMARAAATRRRQELELARRADATVVVSPVEKEILVRDVPELRVEVISNIHSVHGSATGFDQRKGIVFVGNFNHPANTDAVLYYAREIEPLVRERLGDVATYIIGNQPPPKVRQLARESVIVTGHVPDLSTYLNTCRLSVAPLRYGAGIKGKINLSMAYGVPVVATPVAIEGMRLVDGRDVLVANRPSEFAEAIARAYQDSAVWSRLSQNGLRNVETYFSKDAARAALRRLFRGGEQPAADATNSVRDAASIG